MKPSVPGVPYFKSGWETPFVFQKQTWGVSYTTPTHHIVFGNKLLTLDHLKTQFPDCNFHRLRQTHSDILEWATSETTTPDPTVGPSGIEGDALATEETGTSLGISTADCIPLVIADTNIVANIHAGWKGLKSEIILKSLSRLKEKNFDVGAANAFIGPHILRSSFEVDEDLALIFQGKFDGYIDLCPPSERGYFQESIVTLSKTVKGKAYVDLLNVARMQLCLAGMSFQNIHFYLQDTKMSLHWASFRREGANMGKNLTFVARRTP